jgi:hypothetical protein
MLLPLLLVLLAVVRASPWGPVRHTAASTLSDIRDSRVDGPELPLARHQAVVVRGNTPRNMQADLAAGPPANFLASAGGSWTGRPTDIAYPTGPEGDGRGRDHDWAGQGSRTDGGPRGGPDGSAWSNHEGQTGPWTGSGDWSSWMSKGGGGGRGPGGGAFRPVSSASAYLGQNTSRTVGRLEVAPLGVTNPTVSCLRADEAFLRLSAGGASLPTNTPPAGDISFDGPGDSKVPAGSGAAPTQPGPFPDPPSSAHALPLPYAALLLLPLLWTL